MKQVNVHEAKTHLSRLLDEAESGEEIVIARGGKPSVRLVPVGRDAPGILGSLKGMFVVPDDLGAPLPDDLLDLFEGTARAKALPHGSTISRSVMNGSAKRIFDMPGGSS